MADNRTPKPTIQLRKSVHHLLVDLDKTGTGYIAPLAAVLSELLHKRVSRSSLNMALSGFRQSAPYQEYLQTLKAIPALLQNPQTRPSVTLH